VDDHSASSTEKEINKQKLLSIQVCGICRVYQVVDD